MTTTALAPIQAPVVLPAARYECPPGPSEPWEETAWRVGTFVLRTLLVLPLLHDIAQSAVHWVAGKFVLMTSFNMDTFRVVLTVFAILFSPLVAPVEIFLYFAFNFQNHWALDLLFTLICTALILPVIVVWGANIFMLVSAGPFFGGSTDRSAKRDDVFSQVQNKGLGSIQRLTLVTQDGCTLDGALFIPNGARRDRLLIHTGGNAVYYEYALVRYVNEALALGVPTLSFNPRGSGDSTGSPSAEGLAQDAYTAFRYGMDVMRIQPRHILLHGMSLGASYGTLAAARIQAENPTEPVGIVHERSFCKLDTTVQYFWGDGVIASAAAAGIRWTGWAGLNNTEAFASLKGRRLIISRPEGNDEVIHHFASMKFASTAMRIDQDQSLIDYLDLVFVKNEGEQRAHSAPLTGVEQLLLSLTKRIFLQLT
ncbi:MAG: hypothetical protein HYX48_05620 [Chlamydiales bacterium]|nr:hypothetical protein [Chlamydiales bacterium]